MLSHLLNVQCKIFHVPVHNSSILLSCGEVKCDISMPIPVDCVADVASARRMNGQVVAHDGDAAGGDVECTTDVHGKIVLEGRAFHAVSRHVLRQSDAEAHCRHWLQRGWRWR